MNYDGEVYPLIPHYNAFLLYTPDEKNLICLITTLPTDGSVRQIMLNNMIRAYNNGLHEGMKVGEIKLREKLGEKLGQLLSQLLE